MNNKIREHKGNSLLKFVDDYSVIDIETTGLSPINDEIIEIAAIKVRNNSVVESFSSLVKPLFPIDKFITQFTGITNQMLETAPSIKEVIPEYLNFLADDILIGHNVHFDINFIYDNGMKAIGSPLYNDFIDTLRLSRGFIREVENYRLSTIAKACGANCVQEHRALEDCRTTDVCYRVLKTFSLENYNYNGSGKQQLKASEIITEKKEFDCNNPFFGKLCVFTGELNMLSRRTAMQYVVDLGGRCADNINKNTNYLIMGKDTYRKRTDGDKSSKRKKAEEYILNGLDIEIISEDVFYDVIDLKFEG